MRSLLTGKRYVALLFSHGFTTPTATTTTTTTTTKATTRATHLREHREVVEKLYRQDFPSALRVRVLDRHQPGHGETRVVAPHGSLHLSTERPHQSREQSTNKQNSRLMTRWVHRASNMPAKHSQTGIGFDEEEGILPHVHAPPLAERHTAKETLQLDMAKAWVLSLM